MFNLNISSQLLLADHSLTIATRRVVLYALSIVNEETGIAAIASADFANAFNLADRPATLSGVVELLTGAKFTIAGSDPVLWLTTDPEYDSGVLTLTFNPIVLKHIGAIATDPVAVPFPLLGKVSTARSWALIEVLLPFIGADTVISVSALHEILNTPADSRIGKTLSKFNKIFDTALAGAVEAGLLVTSSILYDESSGTRVASVKFDLALPEQPDLFDSFAIATLTSEAVANAPGIESDPMASTLSSIADSIDSEPMSSDVSTDEDAMKSLADLVDDSVGIPPTNANVSIETSASEADLQAERRSLVGSHFKTQVVVEDEEFDEDEDETDGYVSGAPVLGSPNTAPEITAPIAPVDVEPVRKPIGNTPIVVNFQEILDMDYVLKGWPDPATGVVHLKIGSLFNDLKVGPMGAEVFVETTRSGFMVSATKHKLLTGDQYQVAMGLVNDCVRHFKDINPVGYGSIVLTSHSSRARKQVAPIAATVATNAIANTSSSVPVSTSPPAPKPAVETNAQPTPKTEYNPVAGGNSDRVGSMRPPAAQAPVEQRKATIEAPVEQRVPPIVGTPDKAPTGTPKVVATANTTNAIANVSKVAIADKVKTGTKVVEPTPKLTIGGNLFDIAYAKYEKAHPTNKPETDAVVRWIYLTWFVGPVNVWAYLLEPAGVWLGGFIQAIPGWVYSARARFKLYRAKHDATYRVANKSVEAAERKRLDSLK